MLAVSTFVAGGGLALAVVSEDGGALIDTTNHATQAAASARPAPLAAIFSRRLRARL